MDDSVPLIPQTSSAWLTKSFPFKKVAVFQKIVCPENLGKNKVIEWGVIHLVRT